MKKQGKTEKLKTKNIKSRKTPTGVKIISVLNYIGSVISLIVGIILILGAKMISNLLPSLLPSTGLIITLGVLFIALAILSFFIARGLWQGKKWARTLTLIFIVIGIISALYNLIYLMGIVENIISLIIDLVIGGYLMFNKKAKEFFS